MPPQHVSAAKGVATLGQQVSLDTESNLIFYIYLIKFYCETPLNLVINYV
jgi:hypothetical protein